MKRFTDAVRKSVSDGNWFAGLFLALCLPDICGSLETPDDSVGERYKRWFDENLSQNYSPMFTADDCYYFRCSCLHEGIDSHDKLAHERIHFIPPPPNNNIVHLNKLNNVLQMQIDMFCNDVAEAVDNWYERVKSNPEIESRVANLIQIHPIESLRPFISFG